MVALLLNGIRYDRLDESASKTAGGYQVRLYYFVISIIICQGIFHTTRFAIMYKYDFRFQTDSTLKGVINSFVEVEDYKKKGQLDVSFEKDD